jgi:hypothetical protein
MFKFTWISRITGTAVDITYYVTSGAWSGDIDQAARKLSFSIAYNLKDIGFANQDIILGDTIAMSEVDSDTSKETECFRGIVFTRNRNTADFTFEYTAYDRLIYLAKSKTTRKFSDVMAETAITQIANDNGIAIGNICAIGTILNFIADAMSYTEILKKIFTLASAQTGKYYHFYMNQEKLYVVEQSTVIENYVASDSVNVENSQHEESIEDMVSKIIIVDSNGATIGAITDDSDVGAYGTITDVYKVDPKQDTQSNARALLKTVAFKSTLNAVGNIQCIAGYAVTVQEEQLKGIFTIKSDQHTIGNGIHTMNLTLDYLPSASAALTTATTTGSGNLDIATGLDTGWEAWGNTTMEYGEEGCVEAVGKIGSYYSPFLATECNNGVVNVDTLVADASTDGIPVMDYSADSLSKGDTIIYGDNDHAVIYDGNGGYYGNSSGQNITVHGSDYTEMGGLQPTKILKTSTG